MALMEIMIWVVILIISAIPLNVAVKMLGGKSSIVKVLLVYLMVSLFIMLIEYFIGQGFFASIVVFIGMLFFYKHMFKMGWLRSFLAWIAQFVIIAILGVILALLGVAIAVPTLFDL